MKFKIKRKNSTCGKCISASHFVSNHHRFNYLETIKIGFIISKRISWSMNDLSSSYISSLILESALTTTTTITFSFLIIVHNFEFAIFSNRIRRTKMSTWRVNYFSKRNRIWFDFKLYFSNLPVDLISTQFIWNLFR